MFLIITIVANDNKYFYFIHYEIISVAIVFYILFFIYIAVLNLN